MKVACSFTTIPSRLPLIYPIVEAILNQTRLPDIIYIHIPYISKRGKEYQQKDIVKLEESIQQHKNGHLVKINRVRHDYGAITKLLPTIEIERLCENWENTYVLIIDDDRIMSPRCVESFIRKAEEYPDYALSMSGWIQSGYQFLLGPNVSDTHVDWIEGTNGIFCPLKYLYLEMLLKHINYYY